MRRPAVEPLEGTSRRGMLARSRRYFSLLAFALVATPLVVGLVRPDSPAEIVKEGRRLAPAPGAPDALEDWLALPAAFDAYLRDHFGLRRALIEAHHELTKPMLGLGDDSVLVGRDGRMFYLGEDAVRQSAGLVVRDQSVADAVDLIAAMNAALKRRGIRFLVASPPNAATVYQDDLPDWAKNRGKRTEYDLFLKELAARGIEAIDLRPVMAEARSEGAAYYRHDSHWTPLGALAAFNAVAAADGHPDWRLDSATALAAPSERRGGDLARLLGVQDSVTEEASELALPLGEKTLLTADPYGDYVQSSGRPGPTVMIIGDSFTGAHIEPMLLRHVGRVVWLASQHCGFDWSAIDRFQPDEVWWMPNERFLVCDPGARPRGFVG
jgi:alginate O-acetyltransferase complex protein AlgJ